MAAIAVINIGDFRKSRLICQGELRDLAAKLDAGDNPEMLMESLFERHRAGAKIEDGRLSMATETLRNGDRIVSVTEACDNDELRRQGSRGEV